MKRLFSLVLVLFISMSATSCMNFIENIFFNKDGSGTYSFTIDMGGLKSLAAMGSEDLTPENLMKEVNLDENETEARLKDIPGISNVGTTIDKQAYVVKVHFDFDNINALNDGLNAFMADSTSDQSGPFEFFSKKKKTITRANLNRFMNTFEGALGASETEGVDMNMVKLMFSDVYYTSEIETERRIKSFDNTDYKAEGENKIVWKIYPFKGDDLNADVGVTIKN